MAKNKFASPSKETVSALSAMVAATPVPMSSLPPTKRGLKGVPLSATITLLSAQNPKRKGCAAEVRFSLYKTGMTQEEFLDAGGTTPDMAYDTAHGYISVDGYIPPKIVEPKVRAPKEPKAPKAAKEPKAPKVKKEKSVEQMELEQATEVEMID